MRAGITHRISAAWIKGDGCGRSPPGEDTEKRTTVGTTEALREREAPYRTQSQCPSGFGGFHYGNYADSGNFV